MKISVSVMEDKFRLVIILARIAYHPVPDITKLWNMAALIKKGI